MICVSIFESLKVCEGISSRFQIRENHWQYFHHFRGWYFTIPIPIGQCGTGFKHEIRKVLKLEHLGPYQSTLESLSKLKNLLPLLSSKDKNIHNTPSGDNTKIGEVMKKKNSRTLSPQHDYPLRSKGHQINSILDPKSGSQLEYRHLIKDPLVRNRWETSFWNELRRLSNGFGKSINGTGTISFIPYKGIHFDRRVDITYGIIVVDYRPHKEEPYRTRLTFGGNLINYPSTVISPTDEMSTIKILLNITISTHGDKFCTMDISNFYLGNHMERPEYMFLTLDLIPS